MLDLRAPPLREAVAVGGAVPTNPASGCVHDRGSERPNLRPALGQDSARVPIRAEHQRLLDIVSPVFEDGPTHQPVRKGSGELAHVERVFGLLRQRLGRYVRETRSASQSSRMLHLTTKLFVEWYNQARHLKYSSYRRLEKWFMQQTFGHQTGITGHRDAALSC